MLGKKCNYEDGGVRVTCPLGRKACATYEGAKMVERCAAFHTLDGHDPQNGKEVKVESKCVADWIPLLLVENTSQTWRATTSIQRFQSMALDFMRVVFNYRFQPKQDQDLLSGPKQTEHSSKS